MKKQINYNKFEKYLIATDGWGYAGHNYKPYNPETVERFYKNVMSALEQKEGDVELHCKGRRRTLTSEHTLDGYFGRPKIINHREYFLRKLTPQERKYLETQFSKTSRKEPIKLKLVD